MLTACNTRLVPSVGQADNAIVLMAGISEGPAGVQTKAVDDGHAANPPYGGGHKAFADNTKLKLRVDGIWLDKGFEYNLVSQSTTGTISTVVDDTDGKHRSVEFTSAEKLYWDDYGTADPANMPSVDGNGRAIGLTIYGAAIDGVSTAVDINGESGKQWNALTWALLTNQKSGWSAKDLLTSNNISSAGDGTYKFDDYIHDLTQSPKRSSNLLEFTHAMSMVTVVLTAKEGFDGYSTETPGGGVFTGNPEVTLKNFKYTGTVNIIGKTSTPTSAVSDIMMYRSEGGASSHTATFTALVYPDNEFADETEILTFTADGNTFKVKAKQLNDAIQTAITNRATTHYPDVHDKKFQQGWNYKINITVNKTRIDVTATIKDWVSVSAANEAPVINVTNVYGYEGTAFSSNKSFSFLRSTAKTSGYSIDAQMNYVNSPKSCTLVPTLYWPDHSTHYFFRATWPLIAETGTAGEYIPTSSFIEANAVAVANEKFNAGHYPSEMMLGYPRVSDADGSADETCKVGHKESDGTTPKAGICATQGKINMDFRYAMSQVIVELKTNTAEGATNSVEFNEHTVVEIIDGYTSGKLLLADGSSDFTDKIIGDYTMNRLADDDYDSYKDAIIPQSLTNGTGESARDLKFRISVGNGSGLDVYETVLGIKNIKVNGGEIISAWEPGKKYTYTLTITKTEVKVEATVKDWIDVDAEEDIWF